MNRYLFIVLLLSVVSNTLWAQNIRAPYDKACNCISDIDLGIEKSAQYHQVEKCVNAVIGYNDIISRLKTAKRDGVYQIKGKVEDLPQQLLRNCATLKTILKHSYDLSSVSQSINKGAVKQYSKGLEAYRSQDFKNAQKHFSKAAAKDKNFTMAWDMLGKSYEKLKNNKEALAAYNKSVQVNPFGSVALINRAELYTRMGQKEKVTDALEKYVKTYPNDPDGYYKLGRAYHKLKDFEPALDNAMKAFKIYKKNNSPYSKEALVTITLLYNDLEEMNRIDIWETYSKKHNLTIQ